MKKYAMDRTMKAVVGTMVKIIAVVAFIVFVGLVEGSLARYTRDAVVVNVENDVVTVVDTTDNEWEFEGVGYEEGQEVILKMFTNHTDSNIYDDVIENVKIVK